MTTLEQLEHHTVYLKGGGKIVILDSGAVLTPEMTSMLQALHSRSTGGIDAHLNVLAEKGAEGFMEKYFVKYGHKSIGDCGFAVVFIEGVSMLAAKAIQDSPLYNGQEASTRYIPFDRQEIIDPVNTAASNAVLENWRAFYLKAVEEMKSKLPEHYPFEFDPNSDKSEKEQRQTWINAINARAFDICRCFLPAGTSTNLAWTTTLRQFGDRIAVLRNHPLEEVREIGEKLEDAMIDVYPSSFKKRRYEETEAYHEGICQESYYYHNPDCPEMELVHDGIDRKGLLPYRAVFENKPEKAELPKWVGAYGTAAFEWTLDFGSFRDVQRHRAVTQRMPLLTDEIGFHEWYLDEIGMVSPALRAEAEEIIASQKAATDGLTSDQHIKQFYLPMGYKISCRHNGDLSAHTYLVQLRASSKVHPTLAFQAEAMAKLLETEYKELGLKIELGTVAGQFDVRRGDDTIVDTEAES